VPLVQIPTTLLAQVDSSIGGKVAVDNGRLKNIIGAFYQPKLTVADISLVKSLSNREIGDGMAEVIKYGLIQDNQFFSYLERDLDKIKALDDETLEYIVYRSAEIKARFVEEDEKDTGLRNILNFGHTIGHALETVSDFKMSHGEAVALGMAAAGKISRKLDMLDNSALSRMLQVLNRAGLPTGLPGFDINAIMQAIQHDKKMSQGKLRFILVRSLGNAVISDEVTLDLIKETLLNWNE
jgi:3-dehydroquinate synthase